MRRPACALRASTYTRTVSADRPAFALRATAGKSAGEETGDDLGPEEPFCFVMTGLQTMNASGRTYSHDSHLPVSVEVLTEGHFIRSRTASDCSRTDERGVNLLFLGSSHLAKLISMSFASQENS